MEGALGAFGPQDVAQATDRLEPVDLALRLLPDLGADGLDLFTLEVALGIDERTPREEQQPALLILADLEDARCAIGDEPRDVLLELHLVRHATSARSPGHRSPAGSA